MCQKPSKWLGPALPLLGFYSMEKVFFKKFQKFMFKDVYHFSVCNIKVGCKL